MGIIDDVGGVSVVNGVGEREGERVGGVGVDAVGVAV